MTIKDDLAAELKDAMRERDGARADVVRQINTEIQRVVTAPGFDAEPDDDLYRVTIAAYAKKMRKALVEYEGYGERGAEAAAKLRFEVEYLQRWLPESVSAADLGEIVDAAIAELGASDPSAIGRVMGHIMKNHDGLDGTAVNRAVRERLSSEG
ncbi:MAG: hypothetical protein GKS06_09555 [Acidobacteria bacterium]|nr:hypothetical protein [Acidobacteriota bacterium]